MKGQTQAVTTVLITSITISAIAAAYVWGTPILEKRESTSQLQGAENDVMKLHESIITTSKSGSGTTSEVNLNVPDGRVIIDEKNDYIEIQAEAIDPPYARNTWSLLKGKSLQNLSIGKGNYGIKGKDLPGVVAVKAPPGGDTTVVKYRIDFRNLKTTSSPATLQKIDLRTVGRSEADGNSKLIISNRGTETDPSVKISNSEDLRRTRTIMEIDIQ